MMKGIIVVNKEVDIPKEILCTFARKVTRGVNYFVGYRKGDVIHVHFSIRKYELKDIISYQPVLSPANRIIKT